MLPKLAVAYSNASEHASRSEYIPKNARCSVRQAAVPPAAACGYKKPIRSREQKSKRLGVFGDES